LRARQAKRAVSETGIVGLSGRAVTRVAPEGTVFVRNELWRARARSNIAEGEGVRVTGMDGLTLKVAALKADVLKDDPL
jgi:membrane-bound serine protease (ClpP class)